MSETTVQHETAAKNRAERRKSGRHIPKPLSFHNPRHRTGRASLYTHVMVPTRKPGNGNRLFAWKREAIAEVQS